MNQEIWNRLLPYIELDNPEYITAERMGRWTGAIPRKILMWKRDGAYISLPYGLKKILVQSGLVFDDYTGIGLRVDYKMRPFDESFLDMKAQRDAVETARREGNGIVVMPCGTGKTQTALRLVASLGVRSLWLTHTKDLLNQSLNRAKSLFGLLPSDFGTITEGKIAVGEAITFATVQTLSQNRDAIEYYKDYFDCIIVDECHHAVGSPTRMTMFSRVLDGMNAFYKFGLTATPDRTDGLSRAMVALLGGKIFESAADTERTVPVVVREIMSGAWNPATRDVTNIDGTLDWNKCLEKLTSCSARNRELLELVREAEKPCLILSDRVEHCRELQLDWTNNYETGTDDIATYLVGKVSAKTRYEILSNVPPIIFATYPLAKEGLDIPQLRTVVFATPTKNKITVTQSVGRVMRRADGKEYGTVIDYVDTGFGRTVKLYKERKTIYRRLKCQVL